MIKIERNGGDSSTEDYVEAPRAGFCERYSKEEEDSEAQYRVETKKKKIKRQMASERRLA
jgi:hypothetical protein